MEYASLLAGLQSYDKDNIVGGLAMDLSRPIKGLVFASAIILATGGMAHAACYGPQQQLPAATVAQFTGDPAALLTRFPIGGAQMISMVRDLVASDPTTLPLILDLITNANGDQINAIGTGLGQSALICVRTDQAFANEIQQMVAAIDNQALKLAFAAVFGDQGIGAVTGGGGLGVGGGGGQTSTTSGIDLLQSASKKTRLVTKSNSRW